MFMGMGARAGRGRSDHTDCATDLSTAILLASVRTWVSTGVHGSILPNVSVSSTKRRRGSERARLSSPKQHRRRSGVGNGRISILAAALVDTNVFVNPFLQ